MAYAVSISEQHNNSLGTCWLCKFEDDFSGELLDKCLYQRSDYSANEAFIAFMKDYVRDDDIYVEDIYIFDAAKEDYDLVAFAQKYKAKYGIEYRNMHTAIHHLLVFEDEQVARYQACQIEKADCSEEVVDNALRLATDDFEIDFRDIENYVLENGEVWRYYDDDAYGIFIINNVSYDFYS